MDLREDYKKEKGKWASVVCSDAEGNTYFTDDYVEWLEEKLVKLTTNYQTITDTDIMRVT